jgi:hypothetical protein
MLRFSALTALPRNPRHLTYSLVHFFFPNILCSEFKSDLIPSELFVPDTSGILDQIFIAPWSSGKLSVFSDQASHRVSDGTWYKRGRTEWTTVLHEHDHLCRTTYYPFQLSVKSAHGNKYLLLLLASRKATRISETKRPNSYEINKVLSNTSLPVRSVQSNALTRLNPAQTVSVTMWKRVA